MAIKDQATLLSEIAAFSATHTGTEYKNILTDMVDSLFAVIGGAGRVWAFSNQTLTANTQSTVNHDLAEDYGVGTVISVWVGSGSGAALPATWTYIDDNNIDINWTGTTGTTYTVYIQGY